jgi:hypothetical protein
MTSSATARIFAGKSRPSAFAVLRSRSVTVPAAISSSQRRPRMIGPVRAGVTNLCLARRADKTHPPNEFQNIESKCPAFAETYRREERRATGLRSVVHIGRLGLLGRSQMPEYQQWQFNATIAANTSVYGWSASWQGLPHPNKGPLLIGADPIPGQTPEVDLAVYDITKCRSANAGEVFYTWGVRNLGQADAQFNIEAIIFEDLRRPGQ